MKLIDVFIFFVLLASSSCDKEEYCYFGICDWDGFSSQSTLNNSEPWVANRVSFEASNPNKAYVRIDLVNEFEELRESISFVNFELRVSEITLYTLTGLAEENQGKPKASYRTYTADGDAVTGSYRLYEKRDLPNTMSISRISEDSTEIEGTYQLNFIAEVKADSLKPDTLIFTDGVFKARIFE